MAVGGAVFDVAIGLDALIGFLLLQRRIEEGRSWGGSTTRPISSSFQANSSGIGLSCPHAGPAIMTTAAINADLKNAIPDTPSVSSLFSLTWPIPRPICTDFTVTIRCICATQMANLEQQ